MPVNVGALTVPAGVPALTAAVEPDRVAADTPELEDVKSLTLDPDVASANVPAPWVWVARAEPVKVGALFVPAGVKLAVPFVPAGVKLAVPFVPAGVKLLVPFVPAGVKLTVPFVPAGVKLLVPLVPAGVPAEVAEIEPAGVI